MSQADETLFHHTEYKMVTFKCPFKGYKQRNKPEYASQMYEMNDIIYKVGLLERDDVLSLTLWRSKVKFQLSLNLKYVIANDNSNTMSDVHEEAKSRGEQSVEFKVDEREMFFEMRDLDKSSIRTLVALFGLHVPLTCVIKETHRGEPEGEEPPIEGETAPQSEGVMSGYPASTSTHSSAWGGAGMDLYSGYGPTAYTGSPILPQKYAGLVNKGATCYMNSMLQTLYHISQLRKSVYRIPIKKDVTEDGPGSIAFALQNLFYQMQISEVSAISTDELIRSFGWTTADAFQQHDVQEFCRVLMDSLEDMMKDCPGVDGTISKLFKGESETYITCIDVDYSSTKKDSFEDVQLQVKGCENIYDSFHSYIQPERLDGANQYLADQHGKQDADKGIRFTKLPPVLLCQLKRFEWDPLFNSQRKVNDKFEFPEALNLNKFVYNPNGVIDVPGSEDGGEGDFKTLEDIPPALPLDGDGDCVMGGEEEDADVKMADMEAEQDENMPIIPPPKRRRQIGGEDDEDTESDADITNSAPPGAATFIRSGSKRSHSQANGYSNGEVFGLDCDFIDRPNEVYPHYRRDGPYQYELHSVLVHSGSTYGGHYKAYIRPDGEGEWVSFNDEYTRSVKDDEALSDNFGGAYQRQSAYMLVYVQSSQLKDVCAKITAEDIPPELKAQIDLKIKEREERERLRQEDARKIDAGFLFLKDSIERHQFGDIGAQTQLVKNRRMYRPSEENDVLTFIDQEFKIDLKEHFVFHLTSRKNFTWRPNKPFFIKPGFRFKDQKRVCSSQRFWKRGSSSPNWNQNKFLIAHRNDMLHVSPAFDAELVLDPSAEIWKSQERGKFCFLILKYFNADASELRVLGGAVVHEHDTFLQDIASKVWPLIGKNQSDGELHFMEEEAFEGQHLNPLTEINQNIIEFGLINGDIIIVQFTPTKDLADPARTHCDEIVKYVDFISSTFPCNFKCASPRQWAYLHKEHLGMDDVPVVRAFTDRIERNAKVVGVQDFIGGKFNIDESYRPEIEVVLKKHALYTGYSEDKMNSWESLHSDKLIEVIWKFEPSAKQGLSITSYTVHIVPMPDMKGEFNKFQFSMRFPASDLASDVVKKVLEIISHPIYCLSDSTYDFRRLSENDIGCWFQHKYHRESVFPAARWSRSSFGYDRVFLFVRKPPDAMVEDQKVDESEEDPDVAMTETSSHSSGSNTESAGGSVVAHTEGTVLPKFGMFVFEAKDSPISFRTQPDKRLCDYLEECRSDLIECVGVKKESVTYKLAAPSSNFSASSSKTRLLSVDSVVCDEFKDLTASDGCSTNPEFLVILVSVASSGGNKRYASSVGMDYNRPLKIRKTNSGSKQQTS